MTRRFLLDTDILIEYLRGNEQAATFLENLEGDLLLSAITIAELFSGVHGDVEQRSLEQFLLAFEVLPVDEDIAKKGGFYRRDYRQSHGTGLADAMIAATAEQTGAALVTFNRRHFPMVTELEVPYLRE